MPISLPAPAPVKAGTATHCPYCALQCGMNVAAGETVAITPRDDIPANAGGLCQKGWTAGELLTGGERLTTPLLHGREVGWDEALDFVADRIRAVQAEHGPDGVAVFGGGGLTNEKAYQLGKFARVVLRTSQIDYNGRFCMSSAAAATNRAFGMDRGLPFPITDLARADAVLLAGGNVAETMPPFVRHLATMRERGGRLVVIDPRVTATARQADLHLQPTPGTDLALALALLHIVIAEGHVDEDYVAARTNGFDAVRTSVAAWWPERVERVTGVPVALMRAAVEILAGADRAAILTGRGTEQHAKGTDTVSAFINLALALGLPGREGSGYGCVTGQGNGQGGREHGQKADQLPGYRKIDDPAARAHVAAVWGVDPDTLPGPGRSAYELLDALGTEAGPRALLLFGSNPLVSAPRAGRVAERLARLDLLVVSDLVMSETAATADVVLPTTQWAEESGTMTNLEGRVLLRRRAVAPPPGVRSDLEILRGLAERLGGAEGFPADPREVFDELRRASAGGIADYAGITYERIAAETGVFWPCPAEDHPGTPRPFLDRFATPDGRARFTPVEHRGPQEDVDGEYPLYLTTGRVLAHYQSGAQTRRIAALNAAAADTFVELHPDLAERLAVTSGDRLRVVSRRGETEGAARVNPGIRPDTVFMPFHWPGANLLTNPALDPASRMPEFKVCAVRVERAG
ncbi:assimilatory nitrate reductase catalytic subunit [Streptosporangium becharense]|uniref:Assimilatory nitrate reductase catalytic subunit n=1 Tax=Streptosporangium becharense TaxID=1816182 RepID=A0A7W9IBW3_9ACTN|nr:molybdopterin oxidoreductase family protein [Streptosporangium becharense]MBB2913782.1 assimilatory nitrate reductase catalytic subunit [Streptosporangium becharense]MBB5817863.1 assimilatory nitrate reductase catalytic subunit [Streptosporangium becharense]